MAKQINRDNGLFEPTEAHRPMAERLTNRWAEAEARARARLARYLAHREQAEGRATLKPSEQP